MKPKILALYLPQFHPFPENDEWWGKGFTEWTNVGKAKPLFRGHDEPRVPTELGYYDLRLPIIREQQAQMAREAGVTAFCYWHYWFGNYKMLNLDDTERQMMSEKCRKLAVDNYSLEASANRTIRQYYEYLELKK